jgi:thioredoxin reductase
MKLMTPDGNCCSRLYPEEMFSEGGASCCGLLAARPRAPPLETSVPGVFAAGDIRAGNIKRVASAVGEGSISVSFVHQVLHE